MSGTARREQKAHAMQQRDEAAEFGLGKMNSNAPSSSDAIRNESIVIADGKRRPGLSSLDSAMISTSTRRLSQRFEPSLYPNVVNLPTIDTADSVWASTSRDGRDRGGKLVPTPGRRSTSALGNDTMEDEDDESRSSSESQLSERKTVEVRHPRSLCSSSRSGRDLDGVGQRSRDVYYLYLL